jgi:hypothetical protein
MADRGGKRGLDERQIMPFIRDLLWWDRDKRSSRQAFRATF